MEGKEALKKLFFDNKDLRVDITLNDRKVCEIYNVINYDLERLEKLENNDLVKSLNKANKKYLEILDTLKDNIYFEIYDNEPNKLYVAENQIDITGKEKLIKEWLNRE